MYVLHMFFSAAATDTLWRTLTAGLKPEHAVETRKLGYNERIIKHKCAGVKEGLRGMQEGEGEGGLALPQSDFLQAQLKCRLLVSCAQILQVLLLMQHVD